MVVSLTSRKPVYNFKHTLSLSLYTWNPNGAPCFDWSKLALFWGGLTLTFKKELKVMAGFNQVVSSFGMQKTLGLYMQSLHPAALGFPRPRISTLGISKPGSFTKPIIPEYETLKNEKQVEKGLTYKDRCDLHPLQTDMTMEFDNHLKMYLLLNSNGDFQPAMLVHMEVKIVGTFQHTCRSFQPDFLGF